MKGKTKRDSEISPTRKWELKRKRKKIINLYEL